MKNLLIMLALTACGPREEKCTDDQDQRYACAAAISGEPTLCGFQPEAIGFEAHFVRTGAQTTLTIEQQAQQSFECAQTSIDQCNYTYACCNGGFCGVELVESPDTDTLGGIIFVSQDLCPYDVVCARK